jgi:hypothetical protein
VNETPALVEHYQTGMPKTAEALEPEPLYTENGGGKKKKNPPAPSVLGVPAKGYYSEVSDHTVKHTSSDKNTIQAAMLKPLFFLKKT